MGFGKAMEKVCIREKSVVVKIEADFTGSCFDSITLLRYNLRRLDIDSLLTWISHFNASGLWGKFGVAFFKFSLCYFSIAVSGQYYIVGT